MNDFLISWQYNAIWLNLGWNDIIARYRRSALGPLWITISMAITLIILGPLYSSLMSNGSKDFILYLSLGMIFWGFISSSINESCNIFNESSQIIKQSDFPFFFYIFRLFIRQIIILMHNLIIIPFVLILTNVTINFNILLFIPAIFLVSIFVISIGIMIAIFSTRFRDIKPIIASVVQLLFFVTPIIWSENSLTGKKEFIVHLNPLAKYLKILRDPFLGLTSNLNTWLYTILCSLLLFLISLFVVSEFRKKISYWV